MRMSTMSSIPKFWKMLNNLRYWLISAVSCFAILSCSEDDGIGSSIQPEEDVLQSYSNTVEVNTSSILADSVLSKYDYFLLGRYVDSKFGEVAAEFASQLDGRIGGLHVPDTAVVTSSSATSGVLNTLLTSINEKYGDILEISQPSNVVVDSTVFILQYSDDFFGDSTALQALSVYELTSALQGRKCFTNEKVSDYCDKSKLLGSTSFQVKNSREIRVSMPAELGERLIDVYTDGSTVESQSDFNSVFPGVYVSHTFNQGTMLQVQVAGVQVYYHYDAILKTTVDGEEVSLASSEIEDESGTPVNPLVSSFFLSANKSVNRVNFVESADLHQVVESLNSGDYTFTYTPAGLYTAVNVSFSALWDSVSVFCKDSEKVMFNSAKLIFHQKSLDWKTNLKSSTYLMLIDKRDVVDFFYNNKQPDGVSSFVAPIDTATNTYTFNITAPTQNRLRGADTLARTDTYGNQLVLVPVTRVSDNSSYYYRQQLWTTATMLYGAECDNDSLSPRMDVVYTKRQ